MVIVRSKAAKRMIPLAIERRFRCVENEITKVFAANLVVFRVRRVTMRETLHPETFSQTRSKAVATVLRTD